MNHKFKLGEKLSVRFEGKIEEVPTSVVKEMFVTWIGIQFDGEKRVVKYQLADNPDNYGNGPKPVFNESNLIKATGA